ncbi:MAG TPA: ATP-binding protein [Candidatus Competibacter phosphatis]|nr:ATP-binding protein [Candidatus Competibacter phosphatis]HMR01835.1 ATP-binding protein [Candidatus Competibacter phosphatis]
MSQGLRELTDPEWSAALEAVLLPRLVGVLETRVAGHCMRVTDLDRELMVRLCGGLRARMPAATVVVLADEPLRVQAPDFAVTGTKLVELRNPLPDDELRPPLLVFVPNDLRPSAEDSFGVATFEDVTVDGIYRELITALLADAPPSGRGALETVLADLRASGWAYADEPALARFLLTAKVNDFDPAALGAALFEVGLIPDFELLVQPERVPARLGRNRECVERITGSTRSERARALDLGLRDPAFCKQLGEFFARAGVADPRDWTHRIVKDRAHWPLAFNRWVFEDGGIAPDAIFIGDLELPDLPVVKNDEADPKLAELIGQRILPISKTGLRKFSVSFRVDPLPATVQGLNRFVAEVVSRDNGPTGLRRRKAAWTRAIDTAKITFSAIGKIEWEEGWHFVRVYAETRDGERIPLVDGQREPLPRSPTAGEQAAPNESDLFYVLTDEEVEVEPPQRAVPRTPSVMHAWFQAQFGAVAQGRDPEAIRVSGRGWVEKHARARAVGTDVLEVRLGKEGRANVLVSSTLAAVERAFLADPLGLNRVRLDIQPTGAIERTPLLLPWPGTEEARRFGAARTELFSAILRGDDQSIVQGADLLELKIPVRDYAGAYVAWLEAALARGAAPDAATARRGFEELRVALGVDSVALVLRDYRGHRREAVLLGSTHPLRLVWHAAWAQLARCWLTQARTVDREFVAPTRDAVLKQLAPAGFPPVVPFGEELGRTALLVDNLNPFWSLYAATDEADPRGLVGDVCSALGLPEPSIGGALIDADYLAARVRRYLVQHPYVGTLTLNAFNAGRATVLADMLVALQRQSEFADLRYDLRLFVPDPDAPGIGEALIELLNPESGITAREADAFSTPTESHLHPKLRLAIRAIEEFRKEPDRHPAHLSFLFDLFPAEEIRAVDARPADEASFVHGLVQPFAVAYREDEQSITWLRWPLHGIPQSLTDAEELTDLLGATAHLLSVATAALARGQCLPNGRPVVALSLSADERALLHQVHEASDWVLTIDRNLGIEFFDHRRHPTRPDYLIDHSPDMANAMSHRLAITSRSVAELEALLAPILRDYGLPASGRHALILLDQLRSLSGRLALKLLSAPTQRAEALGLALSRLFLEHQGVFQNQIVVPLDAHLELYRTLRQNALELGDEVNFRRTDLALFDLDPANRSITCRLVEVKCYNAVGDLSAYEHLKRSIMEQIAQTEQVLAHHFDPRRWDGDRPDRAIKNRDLSALLEFYLARSERHVVIFPEAAEEARCFLRRLDAETYRLAFTRSALVFDFGKTGTESPEQEDGIEFYRIGRDLIQQLVEAAVGETEPSMASTPEARGDLAAEITWELHRRRALAPSIPTYDTAAFLSPVRDRTLGGDRDHSLFYRAPEPPNAEEGQAATTAEPSLPEPAAVPALRPEKSPGETVEPATEAKSALAERRDDSAPLPAPIEMEVVESLAPCDILLGATDPSPQYGVLGEAAGRRVAFDLNQTHTISLFGVQGGGKSYTLGTVVEMASLRIPGINRLPRPLATAIFHYSPTMDYQPEFTSMVGANAVDEQVRQLREVYGAEPRALSDVVLLVPPDKLAERQADYPNLQVLPLRFAASELKASHWKFLMGAVGNQATYIRQLIRIMRSMRDCITLDGLRAGVEASTIPDHLKALAHDRLELASDFIDDAATLTGVVRPGRLVIVDLREEFIEKDFALGLFVVLLELFADARVDGRGFNKLVVFDEAHKYIESPDLVAGLIEVVREMRHKGVSILVASQDPPSVPVSLIELSTQIILHKFNSPAWLKHLQKANAALANLTPERMAQLKAGEAYVWSSKATDEAFSKGAIKVRCRPRATQHGGATKVAVDD